MLMLRKSAVRFLSLSLILILTACGGGSGNSKPPVPPTPPVPPAPLKISLTGSPLTTVNETALYSFQVTTVNASSSSLSFSILNMPPWSAFDTATGKLSGTPNFDDAGLYENIKISVVDGANSATLTAFSIDVVNVNRLPTITISTPSRILETKNITIAFSIVDLDSDDVIVSLENQPSWLTLDDQSENIIGKSSLNDAGSYRFNIVLDDGSSELVRQEISLIVDNAIEVKGKVIDGYIQGALVYLDENLNMLLDESEFSATTDEHGDYILVLPAEKLISLNTLPLRAYLGANANDISRSELDFSSTPITLSLPPIDTSLIEADVYSGAVISPFSDKLFQMVSEEVQKVLTNELSLSELQFYIARAKRIITQDVISAGSILLSETNTAAFISSVIFGDFILHTENLATVATQAQSQIDLRLSQHQAADFDGDGIANDVDTDDDGDNVEDTQDAFPFDITEWLDSDGDGVGDNADVYPNNANCFVVGDGNGDTCYMNLLAENSTVISVIASDDVAYFYQQDGTLVIYDLVTQHVLNTQQIENVTSMIFHEGHQRLYLGLANQGLKYLTEDFALVDFVTGEQCVNALVDADSFLIVLGCGGNAGTYATFNRDGELLDRNENNYDSSRVNAWNSVNNRLYHFRDGSSPNDLYYRTLSSSGEFVDVQESPYHGDYQISGPIVISSDGSKVLLGSGDLYDANTLTWLQSIGERFTQSFWLDNGDLVILLQKNENIILRRYDVDFNLVEIKEIAGNLKAIKSFTDKATFLIEHGEQIQVVYYLPSNDSDNDGVINTEDAFPLDSSASLDSDFDGFPDSWNDGYSTSDNALTLDEFPIDSACWLAIHGNDNGCDFLSTQPNFTPDRTVYDNDGDIYFLSVTNKRIYRWSSVTNQFTNPIVLSSSIFHSFGNSQVMTYSAEHNRIYVGYDSGVVSRFDLDELKEFSFAALGRSINGITAVGKFVLAENTNGAWNTHYILDEQGDVTDSKDWNRHSFTYAWNAQNSRVYFLRDGTSPNDLHYETIDQTLGHITDSGESPYHSGNNIMHPVRISADGSSVILGSGSVFSVDDLTIVADLDLRSADIISKGNFIYSVENQDDLSTLKMWSFTDFSLTAELEFEGSVLALVPNGDELNLVSRLNDGTLTVSVVGIVDNDEDGLPLWWESLYNFDDNNASDAALDSDADGLTNFEEYNLKTNPLFADTDNDGLLDGAEVNTHGTSPLEADTDNDGLSDGAEVNEHGTSPLSADSDSDGLTDSQEVLEYQSNPLSNDTDGDGLSDLYEVNNQLNINLNDANEDNDNDGLVNIDELTNQTNPNKSDTDNDALNDGDEVHMYLTLPLNRDSDGDKMPDGWEVGFAFDPLSSSDSTTDFDNDSYSNKLEFFLGTDPTDMNSVPVTEPWINHRGNAGHNSFIATHIDVDDLSLRWNITLDDVNSLSPAIAADGRILLTGYNYSNEKRLFSLNARNGSINWQNLYADTYTISAPSYRNDKIYIQQTSNSVNTLRAVDIISGDDAFLSEFSQHIGTTFSPTITEEGLYIPDYKFDSDTGEQLWTLNQPSCSNALPTVDSEHYYYFSNGFKIADKNSGEILYSNNDNNYQYVNCSTPVLSTDGDIYAVIDSSLVAFDRRTAETLWDTSLASEQGFSGIPAVALGQVYVLKSGILTVVDQYSGETLWSWNPQNSNNLQGDIIVSSNLVFVQDYNNTYAIDIDTQEQVWSYPVRGKLTLSTEGVLLITQNTGAITAINIGGDSDGDGIDDWWEELYGLDSNDDTDALLNADSDELNNLEEFQHSTNPLNEDSDNDGLSDSDEINTHLSNPLNNDTDNDGMSDAWEVTHGLDLLNEYDAFSDADNDGISNIDEFTEGTDPTDAISKPEVIETIHISFESGVIPDDWTIDETEASSWGVSSLESSDGDYSIFSSDQAAISFSDYFNGNSVKFDLKAQCEYSSSLSIYIDGEHVTNANLSANWQTQELSIPRGRHTLTFKTNECGAYLDNFRFSPLRSLYDMNIQTVTVVNQELRYYGFEQELVQSVAIPQMGQDPRDLTILDDGRIAVFNGVFEPMLSIYNPLHATWHHRSFSDWGIVNNVTYGGIAHSGDYIFVTDMSISGNTTAGVIRFNIDRNDAEFFAGGEYIDLTVGLDDMLYALSGRQVDKYDPITMELLASITITEARAIAVDVDSNLYTASWNGTVKRYSATGVENQLLELRDFYDNASGSFYDMNTFENNSLILTNRSSEVFVLESDFSHLIRQNDNFRGAFIATVPFVDADADGMPKWWEEKFGLSDENELDAQEDMDGEGLINLSEYLHNTNPSVQDTDDDLLNDFVEINDHETDPRISDTDKDNLSDGDEVLTHLTDPLSRDSDGDSFNDGDEVLLYETDPNDELSKPDSITELNIDFSITELSEHWVVPEGSDGSWLLENEMLRSGVISHSQRSQISYQNVFSAGTLSFDTLLDSESCCDYLEVYLDDVKLLTINTQAWQANQLVISAGAHNIKFIYQKDSSVNSGEDAAFIDNVVFSVN